MMQLHPPLLSGGLASRTMSSTGRTAISKVLRAVGLPEPSRRPFLCSLRRCPRVGNTRVRAMDTGSICVTGQCVTERGQGVIEIPCISIIVCKTCRARQ